MTRPPRVAILTVSDRCSRREQDDLSGPALAALCRARLAAQIAAAATVPDEPDQIAAALAEWSRPAPEPIDLILTTGGTGLSPRDSTPEAALRVIQRPCPGLMEAARARCGQGNPRAYLSRGIAGTANQTLILTLPGSPRGATETLEALLDVLPHAIQVLRGEPVDHPR